MGYKSHAQRKAVHASKAEQKKKSPVAKKEDFPEVPEAKKGKFTNWVKRICLVVQHVMQPLR